MALEQSVRRKYPEVNDAMRAQERVAAGQLTDIAEGIAPNATPAEARAVLGERVSSLLSRMDERGQQAITQAENRIAQLSPDMKQAQSSVIVREELEGAYKAARDEERQLWAQIPKEVSVSTGNSKSAVDGIYQDTPEAMRDNISPKAMMYLGPNGRFRGNVPVKELHGLYSALREDARVARAAGELNRARIDGVIADAIMQDIDASPIAGGPMREALAFSRHLNQRFTQGDVGRILGADRVGGDRIAPELTLDRTVGRAGISGGLSVDQLRNATGNDIPALNDYVMGQFTDRMVRDNRISAPRAETYLARNQELLTRLPGVRNQITGAMDQQAAAQGTASRMQSRAADVSAGPAATFANARQAAEVDPILRSPDPARYARQAMMQSGDKGDGVRRAFIDDILGRARDVDASGEVVTSGRKMIARLNDPIYRKALSGVMSRSEMSRMDRIADEFLRLEALRGDIGARGTTQTTGKIMGDAPNPLLSSGLRMAAVRLFSSKGSGAGAGASLQKANMVSGGAKKLLEFLTNDKAEALIVKAINDKETFDLLTWPIERMSKQRESRLIETLTGIMGASAASANDRQ